MGQYIIRRGKFEVETELKSLVELQDKVYEQRGLKFSVDSFRHWYVENPLGPAVSFNAFDGDKMIAHYACVPTEMLIEDRVAKGLLSMATVTHPDYRGQGLFKSLAARTFECAKEEGYEFVVGVANANSFPGFMKHFPFTFIKRLDVKFGLGTKIYPFDSPSFVPYWTKERVIWRSKRHKEDYSIGNSCIIGRYRGIVNTFMGHFDSMLLSTCDLPKTSFSFLPNLYVGTGMKINGLYFNVPKFIKHSPFNLIFMDLTDGRLPVPDKDNFCFQLFDFDVA